MKSSRQRTRSRQSARQAARRPSNPPAAPPVNEKAGAGTEVHVPHPSAVVTVQAPVVTFVRYRDREYMHVNGGLAMTLDVSEAWVARRALEQVELTGAVRLAEQDLRHLSVHG